MATQSHKLNDREKLVYKMMSDGGFFRQTDEEKYEWAKDFIRLAYDQDPHIQSNEDAICAAAQVRFQWTAAEFTHAWKNLEVECGKNWLQRWVFRLFG